MHWLSHLHTVNRHKWLVMKYCFKIGLYKQGFFHDLSKYSPTEFLVGVKYYQGSQSPNNAERKCKGYSSSWLHHKGRNKHHFEYWIDYGSGSDKSITGIEIPAKYVAEMFCDRVAASKVYNGTNYTNSHPLAYYEKDKQYCILHKNTRRLLERLLSMLAMHGEEQTFRYIREHVLSPQNNKVAHNKSFNYS